MVFMVRSSLFRLTPFHFAIFAYIPCAQSHVLTACCMLKGMPYCLLSLHRAPQAMATATKRHGCACQTHRARQQHQWRADHLPSLLMTLPAPAPNRSVRGSEVAPLGMDPALPALAPWSLRILPCSSAAGAMTMTDELSTPLSLVCCWTASTSCTIIGRRMA